MRSCSRCCSSLVDRFEWRKDGERINWNNEFLSFSHNLFSAIMVLATDGFIVVLPHRLFGTQLRMLQMKFQWNLIHACARSFVNCNNSLLGHIHCKWKRRVMVYTFHSTTHGLNKLHDNKFLYNVSPSVFELALHKVKAEFGKHYQYYTLCDVDAKQASVVIIAFWPFLFVSMSLWTNKKTFFIITLISHFQTGSTLFSNQKVHEYDVIHML